jgi:hypothetical protein
MLTSKKVRDFGDSYIKFQWNVVVSEINYFKSSGLPINCYKNKLRLLRVDKELLETEARNRGVFLESSSF